MLFSVANNIIKSTIIKKMELICLVSYIIQDGENL